MASNIAQKCHIPTMIIDSKRNKQYRVIEPVGRGARGKCFRVELISSALPSTQGTNVYYVAKQIDKHNSKHNSLKLRLEKEINVHKQLAHTNVVRFYRAFEDDTHVYLLLEWCSLGSLKQYMQHQPDKRLTEQQTRYFTKQLIEGIQYLQNKHIAHRDIKLSNIFVNEQHVLKIGDFDLVVQLSHTDTTEQMFCGSPNYMAPEVIQYKPAGVAVDIYAIGICMFNMLYGFCPFAGKSKYEVYCNIEKHNLVFPTNISISEDAKDLITKLVTFEADKRISLLDALQHRFFTQQQQQH